MSLFLFPSSVQKAKVKGSCRDSTSTENARSSKRSLHLIPMESKGPTEKRPWMHAEAQQTLKDPWRTSGLKHEDPNWFWPRRFQSIARDFPHFCQAWDQPGAVWPPMHTHVIGEGINMYHPQPFLKHINLKMVPPSPLQDGSVASAGSSEGENGPMEYDWTWSTHAQASVCTQRNFHQNQYGLVQSYERKLIHSHTLIHPKLVKTL